MFLSKKGRYRLSATVLIILLYIPSAYIALAAGFILPQSILIYAMLIVFAGVLLGSWHAWATTIVVVLTLMATSAAQISGVYSPDLSWLSDLPGSYADAIVLSVTLFNIALVSWLSNRELEKQKEVLENRVKERTQELEDSQAERIHQLSRFADFGKSSSSLIHDLATPLSVLSLHLQQGQSVGLDDAAKMKEHIDQALRAERKMESFLKSVQDQLSQKTTEELFSIETVITEAIRMSKHKAHKNGVSISFEPSGDSIKHHGNPISFTKVIINLISNAIDAYDDVSDETDRTVDVNLSQTPGSTKITVSDHGCGIKPGEAENIFQAFHTTKLPKKGVGIGLSISKAIIEDEFSGTLTFTSKGETIFTVELAKHQRS